MSGTAIWVEEPDQIHIGVGNTPGLPPGGTVGQVVTKTGAGNYQAGWHTLVWSGSQAAYDALPTKDPTTLYVII